MGENTHMSDTRDELFDIGGTNILIAGAGGGLAAALVRALDARGANLFLTDKDPARLKAIAAAVPNAASRVTDITDPDGLADAVREATDTFGPLYGAINGAGVLPIASARTLEDRVFTECQDINVTGAFYFSREVAGGMPDGGRIVHLASVSSFVANPGYAAYASSKGGLAQLVRVLAREWAADGIAVNAIGPALTETPLTEEYLSDPAFRRNAVSVIPMGRLGTPEDLVGTVLLLLAPGGAFITGQTICVDGGRTLV